MVSYVPALERLVSELSKLPGVGPKTAQRLAYHILRSPADYNEALQEALREVSANVHECPVCFSYTEEELCHFCTDSNRRDDLICVVEDPADIARIDSSGAFRGRYHVLHGAISPLEGIRPEDIRLAPLLERVKSGVVEVILALDADLEGDTTVLYIAKQLGAMDIKVTRIAHGIPIGGDIDYIDHRTLGRALENRIEL
jgi:recombination protein RecR